MLVSCLKDYILIDLPRLSNILFCFFRYGHIDIFKDYPASLNCKDILKIHSRNSSLLIFLPSHSLYDHINTTLLIPNYMLNITVAILIEHIIPSRLQTPLYLPQQDC